MDSNLFGVVASIVRAGTGSSSMAASRPSSPCGGSSPLLMALSQIMRRCCEVCLGMRDWKGARLVLTWGRDH